MNRPAHQHEDARRGLGLHIKLTLALAVLVAVIVAGSAYFAILREQGQRLRELDQHATQIAALLSSSLAQPLWNVDVKGIETQLSAMSEDPEVAELAVTAVNYGPVATISGTHGAGAAGGLQRVRPIKYTSLAGQAETIGEIRVVLSRAVTDEKIADLGRDILLIAATGIVILCAASFALLRRMVGQPVRRLEKMVDRIAGGDLSVRCPVESGDELGRLAARFNSMADRLKEREAKIRRLVEANIIGIFIWELEGRILEANDAFLRVVGYDRSDLIAGRLHRTNLTPPEWRDRTALALAELKMTGTIQPYENEFFRKDGSRVPVLLGSAGFDGTAHQGVTFVLDLTQRKQAEAEARESERRYREVQMELAHANRVATMGQLTASIAHEVNQPIAAARINAASGLRFLSRNPPDLGEAREALERIVKDADRAGDVISRIRAHVKKVPPRKDGVAINDAILEVVALTHSEALICAVSVRTELAGGLPLVEGDRVELQQVILNLIMNAIEAMSGTKDAPRELLISTGRAETDGVLVAVRDSGPGLAPAVVERLFDAFYTTKPSGLGLGLAICRSIIEAHGGRLWATTNSPRGAVFQVILPPLAGPLPRCAAPMRLHQS